MQAEKNFYVLSNSIARNSTTLKIECVLIGSVESGEQKKAVVQVKGGKTVTIDAFDYKKYLDMRYEVYLYAPEIINKGNCIEITRGDLEKFYKKNKAILPDEITRWKNLFE